MRTRTNVALQITALTAVILLRVANPGWMVVIAVLTVVPLVVLALPLVLAVATMRRSRLPWRAAVPFAAAAVALVAVAGLYPETDDQDSWVPVTEVFGLPRPEDMAAAYTAGNAALLAYLATLVWTALAIVTTLPGHHRGRPARASGVGKNSFTGTGPGSHRRHRTARAGPPASPSGTPPVTPRRARNP